MNLVDSSGWLEYLTDNPNADKFAAPLRDMEALLVPTTCLYEVFKVALRERGEEAAIQVVALMQQGNVVDLNDTIALQAAKSTRRERPKTLTFISLNQFIILIFSGLGRLPVASPCPLNFQSTIQQCP